MSYGTRDEHGNLIRDPANPHGLPAALTAEERAARLERLDQARHSANVALDRLEELKLRSLRPEGPIELEPIAWWTA